MNSWIPRIVVMMSQRNPVGEEYLKATLNAGIIPDAIIIEVSKFSDRCEKYNHERMDGEYQPPSVVQQLDGLQVPVYLVKKHVSSYTRHLLDNLLPDIVIAGGVGGILKDNILQIPKVGFIGCHPGVCPIVKGSNVVANAILDDKPLGATCFIMDEGIDTGDIIHINIMPVYEKDSYFALETRMLKCAGRTLKESLIKIKREGPSFTRTKQGEQGEWEGLVWDAHEYKANEESVNRAIEKLIRREYAHYEKV